MYQILLETADGGFVASVEVPPFSKPPDVVIWGERCFKLHQDGGVAIYREAFTYCVPVHA